LKNIRRHFTLHDKNNDGLLKKGEIWN